MGEAENSKFKEIRRLIQGKYFLSNEINNKPTYIHVIKVVSNSSFAFEDDYTTIADVIMVDWLEYRKNMIWFLGEKRMKRFGYKRISKKEFDNGIKTWGKFKIDDGISKTAKGNEEF